MTVVPSVVTETVMTVVVLWTVTVMTVTPSDVIETVMTVVGCCDSDSNDSLYLVL